MPRSDMICSNAVDFVDDRWHICFAGRCRCRRCGSHCVHYFRNCLAEKEQFAERSPCSLRTSKHHNAGPMQSLHRFDIFVLVPIGSNFDLLDRCWLIVNNQNKRQNTYPLERCYSNVLWGRQCCSFVLLFGHCPAEISCRCRHFDCWNCPYFDKEEMYKILIKPSR